MKANLRLENVGSIENGDISISKINVVGGVNSSGKSLVSRMIYCHLKSQSDLESVNYLMDSEGLSNLKDENILFEGDLDISDVFYINNISVLDLKDFDILRVDHIIHIKEALETETGSVCSQTQVILKKINKIIDNDFTRSTSLSSGIKEIGIIQILLSNGKLKRNSFLIMDEPEANLHPEWEIKFAEILILLAKELNIHLYLNSHSPMFIEAISLYAQYYDLLDDTNFYLTQKSNDKYTFKKINPKNMGLVYENLTKPYDELDKIKAKILFKE